MSLLPISHPHEYLLTLLPAFETVGVSLLITVAQIVLLNVMSKTLPDIAPGVNPSDVINTAGGASELRSVLFSQDQLPGVLKAYMKGLKSAFAVAIACAALALVVSVFGIWRQIPAGSPEDNEDDQ